MNKTVSIKEILKSTENTFTKAGVDSPAFDAMCMIEKIFNVTQTDLILNKEIATTAPLLSQLDEFVNRRINGEPLQYILGCWQFYGYAFYVGDGVLIPRDDTEVLLSVCLDFIKKKPDAKVLDLCSGSGALAVTIAKETQADVTAVEKSDKAFSYLTKNIQFNNAKVKTVKGDIFTCMDLFDDNSFDLILSNPPYIKTDEIPTLQKEISFEPVMALDGGADGYDFYKHIVNCWSTKIKNNGMLAFELGEGQFDTVKKLMEAQNYKNIGEKLDLGNIQRVIYGTYVSI